MSIKTVDKIVKKTDPYATKQERSAHRRANLAEKEKYPAQFKETKGIEKNLGKNEYLGERFKNGDIRISKKVPKRDRKSVILHEKIHKV